MQKQKNILCVKFLSRLLFLSVFACSCNLNILATGDDLIPDYTIDDKGVDWFGKPKDMPKDVTANNGGNNTGANLGSGSGANSLTNNSLKNKPEIAVDLSESDVQEIKNLNLTDADLDDEPGLIAKIKSKLPNLNISKSLLQKILKIAAIIIASCAASYVGYKFICAAASTIADVVDTACKSAVVLAVMVLITKLGAGR